MEQMMPMNESPQPTRAMRLIFEYEGNNVRLVSQQPVEMPVTGASLSQVTYPGYYIDTRDTNDSTLSRVVAHGAFSTSTEVFPERHGEPITRIDLPQAKGAFTVITPVPVNTDHVTVIQITPKQPGSNLPTAKTTSPASGAPQVKDIASFKLSAATNTNQQGGKP
jgi:hypothetical protein